MCVLRGESGGIGILRKIRTRPLDRRIARLVRVATGLALVILSSAFVGQDLYEFGRSWLDDLTVRTETLAAASRSTLERGDEAVAEEQLASATAAAGIDCAFLYARDGEVLATSSASAPDVCSAPPAPYAAGFELGRTHFALSRLVVDDGELLGSLQLVADLRPVYTRMAIDGGIQLAVVGVIMWIVGAFVSRLQRKIARPIIDLTETVRRISAEKSFSERVERNGTGEVVTLVKVFNELFGEIQKRDRQLSESDQRMRAILESIADGIVTTNSGHTIEIVNNAAEEMFGYQACEMIGENVHRFMPGLRQEARDADTARYIGSGEAMIIAAGVEVEGQRKGGATFPVELAVSEAHLGDRRVFTNTIRDISDRREAEEDKSQLECRLRQSQKMEALGTLAGGIAHDFNNVLGVIIGSAELAMNKVNADSQPYTNLERILQAGYRAKELVKQMLTFSRQAEAERNPIKLDSVVEEALKLLEASLPAMVEVRRSINSSAGCVVADETQIHQILMNLCTNANHAMTDTGGVLEVSLDAVTINAELVGAHSQVPAGAYVKMSVSDTGHGIDEETLLRIFDPFFTTKGVDGGTGMGLAVVHGIIVDYGGAITVASTPGMGTRFDIYLPRHEGAPSFDQVASTAACPATGSGRVLVVDDEAALAETAREMLQDLGYSVTTMVSSTAALTVFRAQPDRYDVVITDQSMPDLKGTDFAQALMQVRPDIPIILATGYSKQLTPEMALEAGIRGYIAKPYTADDLRVAIHQALYEAAPAPEPAHV